MKKFLLFIIAIFTLSALSFSQEQEQIDALESVIDSLKHSFDSTTVDGKKAFQMSKKDIVKKGISFGPLPIVAFDQDKGFQAGALLNIYDFGDGSNYPNPRQHWYIEGSYYTKGSQWYVLSYDTRFLIPGVRFSFASTFSVETMLDFYGFNGYQSFYDHENVNKYSKIIKTDKQINDPAFNPEYLTPYYRYGRRWLSAKADFIGNIWQNKFFWEAGYHFNGYYIHSIDRDAYNKGKDESITYPSSVNTLYDLYRQWGIISDSEASGGISSALRVGLRWDTRDVENAPTKGIWAEAHAIVAPKIFGTTHEYYRYCLNFRHYVPIFTSKKDETGLVFAYRLNYQGAFGNYTPFYAIPFFTTVGNGYDRDGLGGYRTVRGIIRDRVQGLDMFFLNSEFRWKFVNFTLWKQNIALGLNAFFDGAMVTRGYDMSLRPNMSLAREGEDSFSYKERITESYNNYMAKGTKESLHMAAGVGFRFIMNKNFIIALEYGLPFNKQDGNGAFYFNTGYLF